MQSEENENLVSKFIELHRAQLESIDLPEIHWRDLYMKLKEEIFDGGYHFQIRQRVTEDDELLGYKAICINEKGLSKNDPTAVFLIDHAWTYKINTARAHLRENPVLLERMCKMLAIESEVLEERVEAIFENMWRYNQTYQLGSNNLKDEDLEPIWYIMDEFGTSIRHNDDPTVKCAPFYFLQTGVMFSIMWLTKNLKIGEELTRDYVYETKNETLRRCKLIPFLEDLDDEDYYFDEDSIEQSEPNDEYFNVARNDEKLPTILNETTKCTSFPSDKKVNVYTDIVSVKENLTDDRFVLVDDIEKADVRFVIDHFKEYKDLYEKYPNCLVNQFPFENIITTKDMLAIVSRRVEGSINWLPKTFNLTYELSKFITHFKEREDNDLDNHWILKPWNLARSLDVTITKNLNQIIRSHETGPKIACKYIENPVLYYRHEISNRVKFDIRYIVLLKSISPLEVYCYNVFWLRFANKAYSLDELDNYEKHFTVMNYKDFNLKQVHYDEFIPEFEKQYADFKWSDIQVKIFQMIRQVFEGASKSEPPKGLANNPQSRAMYAIDLMLDWHEIDGQKTIQPKICEVNFMPDCNRACKYHPSFFNDVFNTLFIDDVKVKNVTRI